jgi:hypothetical protein
VSAHKHSFVRNSATGRMRCECGVYGYQRGSRTVPMVCQFEFEGRKHCGRDAVHVEPCNRNASRCAEHAPAKTIAA